MKHDNAPKAISKDIYSFDMRICTQQEWAG